MSRLVRNPPKAALVGTRRWAEGRKAHQNRAQWPNSGAFFYGLYLPMVIPCVVRFARSLGYHSHRSAPLGRTADDAMFPRSSVRKEGSGSKVLRVRRVSVRRARECVTMISP